jgi:glucokinase
MGLPQLQNARTYPVGEFATLGDALGDYLSELPSALQPTRAVLAVASAVTGDHVHFTNSHWSFSISRLRSDLDMHALHVVNDFAAVAWAVSALGAADVEAIGHANPCDLHAAGMRVVVGPGTGLGVAAVKSDGHDSVILESEGGHVSFAPRNEDELFLLRFMMQRFDRVSYERLLCGEGLVNLHHAWCARRSVPAATRMPEDVTRAARAGDPVACETTRSFCSVFGSFAGDVALMFGAWRGVYLAGGLLPHLFDADGARAFHASFIDKGRFGPLLADIPILRIRRTDVGNFGAAVYGARALVDSPTTRTA